MDTDLTNLENELKRHHAGGFIAAVAGALDKADSNVLLSVRAFYGEPELMYTALSYASARGATVIMVPEGKDAHVTFHRPTA